MEGEADGGESLLHSRESVIGLLNETLEAIDERSDHDEEERDNHGGTGPRVVDVVAEKGDTGPDAATEEAAKENAECNRSANTNAVDIAFVLSKTTNETLMRTKVRTVPIREQQQREDMIKHCKNNTQKDATTWGIQTRREQR